MSNGLRVVLLLLDWLLNWWSDLLRLLGGGQNHLLGIERLHHLGSSLQLSMTEASGVLSECAVATRFLGERSTHFTNLFLVSDVILPVVVEFLFLQHSLLVE